MSGYQWGGTCTNAPNVQDGKGYTSDCNNNYFYEYPPNTGDSQTAQQACQTCLGNQSYQGGGGGETSQNGIPSGYIFGGSCKNAPDNVDGRGYLATTTGNHYWYENALNINNNDAPSAKQACQGSNYNNTSGGGGGITAQEQNMINSAVNNPNIAEEYEYFNESNYVLILLVLAVAIAGGIYLYKKHH